MAEQEYQFCLIDPEGDYEDFMGALQLGSPKAPPDVSHVLKALEDPTQNIVVNLLGVALADRPLFFASLLPPLLDMRAQKARPHWLIVDEAHHMLPASWAPAAAMLPQSMTGTILITVHPEMVATPALEHIKVAVAVGKSADETLGGLARAVEEPEPHVPKRDLEPGRAIVWLRTERRAPFEITIAAGKSERRRHLRKYAEGDLGADHSFYFRGPEDKLNLRPQNLNMFATMADGVDDETWLFHLRQGDYSRWLRKIIKDDALAQTADLVRQEQDLSPEESRAQIKAAIEERYTAGA